MNKPAFATNTNKSREAHEKIQHLESRNTFLEEKVKVLKHQILALAGASPPGGAGVRRYRSSLAVNSSGAAEPVLGARSRPASATAASGAQLPGSRKSPAHLAHHHEDSADEIMDHYAGRRSASEIRRRRPERRSFQHGRPRLGGHGSTPLLREAGKDAEDASFVAAGISEKAVQLLEEAKNDNLQLHRDVEEMKIQLGNREGELEELREQFQKRELEHDEEVFTLRKELLEGKREELETGVRSNVQVLKLQAELGSRDQIIASLRAQMRTLTETATSMKRANSGLISQIEELNEQLKTEQTRSLQLQERLRGLPSLERDLSEARTQSKTLSDENKSLRETNDQLVNAAFDRENEMQRRERHLADKLSNAEKLVNAENADLRASLEQALRAKSCLESDVEQLERRVRNSEDLARQAEDRLRRKEQELIFEQRDRKMLEQRQIHQQRVKQDSRMQLPQSPKRQLVHNGTNTGDEFKCKTCSSPTRMRLMKELDVLPERNDSMTKRELADLQLQFLKVNAELEKTRSLLIVQHKMSEGYENEIDLYKRRVADMEKSEHAERSRTKSSLMMKDKKISELESQVRSMYLSASSPPETLVDQLVVPRGQSLLCLHLSQLDLLNTFPETTRQGQDDSTSSTSRILAVAVMNKWFFRVELDGNLKNSHITGSSSQALSTTVFYRMIPDEAMREKFESERTIKLEVREITSGSSKSKLLAECDLSLRDLVKFPGNRLHGTATLVQAVTARPGSAMSVNRHQVARRLYDLEVGHCHYWVRWLSEDNRKMLLDEDWGMANGHNVKPGGGRPTPAARGRPQQNPTQTTAQRNPRLQQSSVESSMDDDEDDVISVRRKSSVVQHRPVKPPRHFIGGATSDGATPGGRESAAGRNSDQPDNRGTSRKASDQSIDSSLPESELDEHKFPSLTDYAGESNRDGQQEENRANSQNASETGHALTFTIHHLKMAPNTSVTSPARPADDKLFVEFEFPYVDQEELQTPEAQPISASSQMRYEFRKTVNVTEQQRDVLRSGLASNKALVRFTVVLEPADEGLECEDVGVALADLGACLKTGGDLVGVEVPVVAADNPAEIIGSLNVSISGYDALKSIAEG